jgi:hypothetical protein
VSSSPSSSTAAASRSSGGPWRSLALAAAVALANLVGCGDWVEAARVPLVPANAAFSLADAVWFEDEQTLFVFWRFGADQGLGPTSRIEIGVQTANTLQAPQPVDDYEPVHRHVDVDCGVRGRCGSLSIRVREEPLSVPIRLRWHEDGELVLEQDAALTIMRAGEPWKQRSAVVYGVFDEENAHVQWRLRHQFPNLGNLDVQALGLRRTFRVQDQRVGDLDPAARAGFVENPWGYALLPSCPAGFVAHDDDGLATDDRAIFSTNSIDPLLVTRQVVCAAAEVTDATGTFTATALARRNPDVVPAFPFLRTPVAEARRVQFDLVTCTNVVDPAHLQMQQQRLLHDTATICVDDLEQPDRQGALKARFDAVIDDERLLGDDLVLSVVLNREDADEGIGVAVEAVLQDVLSEERTKTSPRAVGAVVYDSASFEQRIPEAKPYLLWCPAALGIDDLAELVDPSVLNQLYHCAVSLDVAVPVDLPEPFDRLTIAQLPLLATRRQFANYVARYGEGAVGETTKLTLLAPRRGADARDVIIGDGVDDLGGILDPFSPFSSSDIATFFDDEYLTVLPEESLSVCSGDASGNVVVQASLDEMPSALDALPSRHASDPRPRYQLGLRWDGAFYLRFDYRAVIGTTTEVVGLTLPFSPSLPGSVSFREDLWTAASFDLRDELSKCRRFCDHPTFDSAGIYQVLVPFSPGYQNDCYAPRFPTPADGGFPDDP